MMNDNLKSVFDYYENCWDERFRNGHNNISSACHYGFYIDPSVNSIENTRNDYDLSKKKLNDILIEKINVNKNNKIKILDAGCGYGGTMLHLSNHFKNSVIHGITLTDTQILCTQNIINNNNNDKNCKVFFGNFNNCCYNINTYNINEKYDIIFFIESICHANYKKTTIQYGLDMLNPGGSLIVFDYFENIKNDYIPSEILENLNIIKDGMAIPSFININDFNHLNFKEINIQNVTSHILPGMRYSKEKAIKILNTNINNDLMKKHLNGCIQMYNMHKSNHLNYTIVKIVK
tara:strand:+ start:970 stop:1842 length:873 start_codon:yes stop_codon:yes gene_type:complete